MSTSTTTKYPASADAITRAAETPVYSTNPGVARWLLFRQNDRDRIYAALEEKQDRSSSAYRAVLLRQIELANRAEVAMGGWDGTKPEES